ncbi:MAG TPA: ABC transporter permease subunit [Kofleriaceae bacterium]|nr:ABC transporter permease subunit [Kofleriaceae bacterium]
MSTPGGTPTRSPVATLARVTLRRLVRGRGLWVGALIALTPVLYGYVRRMSAGASEPRDLMLSTTPLLVLIPALFVASSIGEELESKTSTYLWSRPIERWQILAGKLCALVPLVIGLVVAGWLVGNLVGAGAAPSAISCVALAAGCVVIALIAAGIALLAPRQGMALTISYLLVDTFIGAWPFSLAELSVTHQVRVLAGLTDDPPAIVTPLVGMLIIAAIWGAVGFRRISRLEV